MELLELPVEVAPAAAAVGERAVVVVARYERHEVGEALFDPEVLQGALPDRW